MDEKDCVFCKYFVQNALSQHQHQLIKHSCYSIALHILTLTNLASYPQSLFTHLIELLEYTVIIFLNNTKRDVVPFTVRKS
jgi:hypothetical protein